MASLQCEPTGVFHIVFRVAGKKYKRSLETKSESLACARRDEVDETLQLLKRGRLQLEPNMPVADFVLAGGDKSKIEAISKPPSVPAKESPNIDELFKKFFQSLPEQNLESNTVQTMVIHQNHILKHFGQRRKIEDLKAPDFQQYINARSKEFTQYKSSKEGEVRKRQVSAITIRKELATFGTVWRSSCEKPYPTRGLRYPKVDEKPPFRTIGEINHQIESFGLSNQDAETLWDCVYLTMEDIRQLLEHIVAQENLPALASAMMTMAAHTGARRSELIRAQRSDVDFATGFVTIRERKRAKGMRSSRTVPISSPLSKTLTDWLRIHPGGSSLFCHETWKTLSTAPLTTDQAQTIFRKSVAGTKWQKLKGWHCLRHSFISNLANKGTDQRIIDEFVGHTTEEMRRRYRHLFPNVKNAAIANVFG